MDLSWNIQIKIDSRLKHFIYQNESSQLYTYYDVERDNLVKDLSA